MMLKSDGNQVLAAFEMILAEFAKSRDDLVKGIAVAAESGDYDAIDELRERLERADVLKGELERLRGEWQWVFNLESVPGELLDSPLFGGDAAVIVPGRYELCNPTLQAIRDLGGNDWWWNIDQKVIEQMNFPEEITRQPHKGGAETELEYQLGWARTTLKTCGMLDNPLQNLWKLNECGSRQQWLTAAQWKTLNQQGLDRRRRGGG